MGVQRFKNESIGESKTIGRVSAQYDIGAVELHGAVGLATEINGAGTAPGANEDEGKAVQLTVGANYNLSKRTKVYAFATKVDNKANVGYMSGTDGADFSSLALGIRHNF